MTDDFSWTVGFLGKLKSYGLYSILFYHLNSNWHQLIIWSFLDEWSHQVLLLPIDGVCLHSIQMFVVTQEYVAFLFGFHEKLRNDLSHIHSIWILHLQNEYIHFIQLETKKIWGFFSSSDHGGRSCHHWQCRITKGRTVHSPCFSPNHRWDVDKIFWSV